MHQLSCKGAFTDTWATLEPKESISRDIEPLLASLKKPLTTIKTFNALNDVSLKGSRLQDLFKALQISSHLLMLNIK